jgi:hypothetical protein
MGDVGSYCSERIGTGLGDGEIKLKLTSAGGNVTSALVTCSYFLKHSADLGTTIWVEAGDAPWCGWFHGTCWCILTSTGVPDRRGGVFLGEFDASAVQWRHQRLRSRRFLVFQAAAQCPAHLLRDVVLVIRQNARSLITSE